jgi:serine/threonine protein kinase
VPTHPEYAGDSLPGLESAPTLPPIHSRDDPARRRRHTEIPAAAPTHDEEEATTLPPAGPPPARSPSYERVSLPGYEILAELGRGGMGVVYQARHLTLNRVVALKMILAGVHASDADLHRFLTEAEAVAQLQHPNIVQLFESGQHEGLPYFTLEFVAGGTLALELEQGPLPPPRRGPSHGTDRTRHPVRP